jgi:hypothetical protein
MHALCIHGTVRVVVANTAHLCPLAVRSTALAAAGVETSEQTTLRYKKLQNQSDIRGISIAGVPGEELSLGPIEVLTVKHQKCVTVYDLLLTELSCDFNCSFSC